MAFVFVLLNYMFSNKGMFLLLARTSWEEDNNHLFYRYIIFLLERQGVDLSKSHLDLAKNPSQWKGFLVG